MIPDLYDVANDVDQCSGAVINCDLEDFADYEDRVRALDDACAAWLRARGR